jgi:hypothetical protein
MGVRQASPNGDMTMSNLDWSIPVAQYTPAHWEAINASEREREARKDNYGEDDVQEMIETMMEED